MNPDNITLNLYPKIFTTLSEYMPLGFWAFFCMYILSLLFNSISKSRRTREIINLKFEVSEINQNLQNLMQELTHNQTESLANRFNQSINSQTISTNQSITDLHSRIDNLIERNNNHLEKIRLTVDDKLHGAIEQKLGESFKQVADKLALVHQGIGEMQHLAKGVGDLKKTLNNVKTRGVWGEIQLEAILAETLTPNQFSKNMLINPNSQERVDYAIKIPSGSSEEPIWIPVDSKFPIESYNRINDAKTKPERDEASKELATQVKLSAKSIAEKYIYTPKTTDFGILFLPIEGLFSEILRIPELVEKIHNQNRIIICGPTTFTALLNSLQLGFRSLTIQERTSEVWKLLGLVRNEFNKFGTTIDGVRKKLSLATNQMDYVSRRSRVLEKTLSRVENLEIGEIEIPLLNEKAL